MPPAPSPALKPEPRQPARSLVQVHVPSTKSEGRSPRPGLARPVLAGPGPSAPRAQPGPKPGWARETGRSGDPAGRVSLGAQSWPPARSARRRRHPAPAPALPAVSFPGGPGVATAPSPQQRPLLARWFGRRPHFDHWLDRRPHFDLWVDRRFDSWPAAARSNRHRTTSGRRGVRLPAPTATRRHPRPAGLTARRDTPLPHFTPSAAQAGTVTIRPPVPSGQ